ncbi:MAG: exonuclease SbcCD subunit D [Planctomycetota bacterium]
MTTTTTTTATTLRVLFLADTHLGFDEPKKPGATSVRLRRGPDFFRNQALALQPALDRERGIDLVIHGGDVFDRSSVTPDLVERAFAPLKEVADSGVPVVVVPGNHERSRIPYPLLALHPHVHIVRRPITLTFDLRGLRLAIAAFPHHDGIRERFGELLAQTGHDASDHAAADIRLLCMHQTVEGATVGPSDYVFRDDGETIRGADIPGDFAAVLTGHIHRRQTLTHDLGKRPLRTPVHYPGSVERTTAAERDEAKGFLILDFAPGSRLVSSTFHELPARPMVDHTFDATGLTHDELRATVKDLLDALPPRALARITVAGRIDGDARPAISAAAVRELTPDDMIVSVRDSRGRQGSEDPTRTAPT